MVYLMKCNHLMQIFFIPLSDINISWLFYSPIIRATDPMIVCGQGMVYMSYEADIAPINLIYWAFNGIPLATTQRYIPI